MRMVVISGSLNPQSRSRVLARRAHELLAGHDVVSQWIDLQQVDIPMCDGTGGSKGGDVAELRQTIDAADGVFLAAPVYNFDVNAAVKNLVEQTGRAWTDKVVGLLCAAGGRASYMSVMSLANSLMLDFRCLIVPRFVYATASDFSDDRTEQMALASDDVSERVAELVAEMVRLAGTSSQH